MPAPIEFDTGRLRLRQWRAGDYEPFARLNADARVMQFFPQMLDRADSNALADHLCDLIAQRGWGLWAVERKDNAEFIGFTGLNVPQTQMPFSPCIDIGWRLAYEHWGNGYATEAAQQVLRIAFDDLQLDEIVSFTALRNLRSRAVMERLQMRSAGTFAHPALDMGSPLREHCLYRLSRLEWRRQQP